MNNAPLPSDVATLHRSVLTLDTHIDIPWPTGPDPFLEGARRVDLPKMVRGSLTAGVFAAYVPQAARTPDSERAAFQRATGMLEVIRAMGRSESGVDASLCVTADEIEAAHAAGALAIVPAVENGFAVGTDLSRLRRFRDLGARYLTLTHNGHNALADSANPRPDLGDKAEEHGGLSGLGREAIGVMNEIGLLVDVSHVSKPSMMQAARLSRTPIVATHSCIRALCNHPRNLDDEQLDMLRDVGGVVHITAVAGFLKPDARGATVTVADFVDHIDYAVRRIGVAHVGISSDFDGGGWFSDWQDAAQSPNLTAELVRRGYGAADIAALWSGNFLRLLRRAEAMAA